MPAMHGEGLGEPVQPLAVHKLHGHAALFGPVGWRAIESLNSWKQISEKQLLYANNSLAVLVPYKHPLIVLSDLSPFQA